MRLRVSHHLRLTGAPSDLQERLTARLTFTNPKWLENRRMGRWNRGTPRTLRYYRRCRGDFILPRGFLRQVLLMCRRRGITVDLEDRRRSLPPMDVAFQATLKPFQREAVERMARRDFGTLCAPTGSGKTVMALALVAARRQPALIVVHTRELAAQWVDRAAAFLAMAESEIGFVGGGRCRPGDRLTVALVQSLLKHAAQVIPRVGFLVADECHRCPSRTFTEAVTRFDCRYMLGLTATPWRRDNLSRLIFWHLGDMHHRIAEQSLVASGDVLAADVTMRITTFQPYHDPVNEYSRMLAELTADDDRNRLIAADVAREIERHGSRCLILSDRKQHCETLASLLRFGHRVSTEVLTGDVAVTRRRDILARFDQGAVQALVATGQLVGEGFDCPALSALFLTTPIRFSGRVLQYLGRVLRPAPGKHRARVYDYVDARVEVLAAAARARERVYSGQRPATEGDPGDTPA